MSPEDGNVSVQSMRQASVAVPQGLDLAAIGLVGLVMIVAPAMLLMPGLSFVEMPWSIIVLMFWACIVAWPVTYIWSLSLHKRITAVRGRLRHAGGLLADEDRNSPTRVNWMPAWLGILERGIYASLIGFDVSAGAVLIGMWIVLKQARGWQVWNKGTTYGNALFTAALLGNAMSLAFGLGSGLVIRALLAG